MNDRVLLELAAKAAGVAGRFIEEIPEDGYPRYRCGIGRVGSVATMWNPLRDDGDALRLSVRLGMSVTVFDGAIGIGCRQLPDGKKYEEFPAGNDVYAATRRAITSAAAEIGRSM